MDPHTLPILVVDDEENIRFALTVCLESDGHKVVAVGTIEAALEEAARQAFDLIFLDVRLGTQNGLDFIKPLLAENPWARIVVITAYASIESAVDAMKLGASDYLSKPFEPAQLRLLTQKVAERRLLDWVTERAFVPVDDGIYYIGRRGDNGQYPLQFFQFSSQTSKVLTNIDGAISLGLSVSPDRTAFLFMFTKTVRSGANLMMIENFR